MRGGQADMKGPLLSPTPKIASHAGGSDRRGPLRALFGREDAIGKRIEVDGHEVRGGWRDESSGDACSWPGRQSHPDPVLHDAQDVSRPLRKIC